MTLLNFFLNTFSSVLNHAIAQPNVADLHALIDSAAAHQQNHSPQHRQRHQNHSPQNPPPPPAPQQTHNARQPSLPPHTQPKASPEQTHTRDTVHSHGTSSLVNSFNASCLNASLEEQHDPRSNTPNIESIKYENKEGATEDHATTNRSNGNDNSKSNGYFTPDDTIIDDLSFIEDTNENVNDTITDNLSFIEDTIENVNKIRYPDGDVKYKILGGASQIGWCMVQFSRSDRRSDNTITNKKRCLGAYQCPIPGCEFRKRPRLPKERNKSAQPRPPKVTHCKVHSHSELVHMPCNVVVECVNRVQEGYVEISHKGKHAHKIPNPIHISTPGKKIIRQKVRSNPRQGPVSMLIGTSDSKRLPIEQDEALVNVDRVRKEKAKERAEVRREREEERIERQELAIGNPTIIAGFDRLTSGDFITSSSMRYSDGHLIIQTPIMRQILINSDTASQTDTIEGFAIDPTIPYINLTVTSTFCHVQEKWVATQYGIMFGRSGVHYGAYFFTLLSNMGFGDFDEFKESYMGMVCDFDQGEKVGFEMGLEKLFGISKEDYDSEAFYAFCTIHFDRSECRIRMKNDVVPLGRKDEFKERVRLLKGDLEPEVFWQIVHYIKDQFKKSARWLDWHLHPDRSKGIFPSTTTVAFANDNGSQRNTNAQESMGRTIQDTYEGTNPNFIELYEHLYRSANKIDVEYACAIKGNPPRYGKQRIKRKWFKSDGPPETNDALFGPLAGKKTKRSKRAANLAPLGSGSYDLTLVIPWSFKLSHPMKVDASNTCALDTILMSLYFLRKYHDDMYLEFKKEKQLTEVLDMIHDRKYALAQYTWIESCHSPAHQRVM